MINKYQQGGAAPQQGGGILALIQQLPKEQLQQLMQAFAQWAQQKGVDIQQLQSNPQVLEQALGQFMQEMQAQQAQMAKHGAKLKFIKSLKHQCPEGEHLEYFAKGGAIGCNCVKNKQGGKTEPKKSALEQFKEKRSKKACGGLKMKQTGGELVEEKCGGKMKKHQIGGTIETLRQSLGLEKKKFVTKHESGGIVKYMEDQDKAMNMMPAGWGAPEVFFLKYLRALKTNPEPSLEDVLAAGDGDKLPTARKAEERYANSTFMPSDHAFFSTSMRFNPKAYHEGVLQTRPAWNYRPAWIAMEVSGNDTTYSERPEQKMGFNNTVIRQASNSDSDKSEYRTLLRRFNTAKGIAKLPEAKEETKSAPVSFTSFLKHMIPGLGEAYNQKVVAKHLFGTTKGGIVERFDNTRVPHNFVRNLK